MIIEIHRKGVIHLDTKPQNILLAQEEDPAKAQQAPFKALITDFGASTCLASNSSYNGQTSVVHGLSMPKTFGITALYAAPEVKD
jgi:serine/threonine protein kinase